MANGVTSSTFGNQGSFIIIDYRSFDEAIDLFSKESGISAHDVLRDQMRIFTEKAIKVLPPESIGQGKKKIFDSSNGHGDVAKVLGAIDDAKALKQLKNMFANRFDPLEFNTDGIGAATDRANKYRTKRGAVKYDAATVKIPNTKLKFGGKMYVTKRIRNAVIREKQAHVGRLKAGWEKAADMLGARIPSWISKHTSPGSSVDTIRDGQGYIEAVNSVPYAERHQSATNTVLQGRVRAMAERIDKELFRLGKKYSAK
jgi:hypothetical protein